MVRRRSAPSRTMRPGWCRSFETRATRAPQDEVSPYPVGCEGRYKSSSTRRVGTSCAKLMTRQPTAAELIGRKRHRLDPIAVGIEDERCVVPHAIMRAQAGGSVGSAAGIQGRRVERVDLAGRSGAKTDVDAAFGSDPRHAGPQIDPEFGIGFAETNRRGPRHKAREPERSQRRLIKAWRTCEISDADGDMIDQEKAPRHALHCQRESAIRCAATAWIASSLSSI